jgi:hypothetical protein
MQFQLFSLLALFAASLHVVSALAPCKMTTGADRPGKYRPQTLPQLLGNLKWCSLCAGGRPLNIQDSAFDVEREGSVTKLEGFQVKSQSPQVTYFVITAQEGVREFKLGPRETCTIEPATITKVDVWTDTTQ